MLLLIVALRRDDEPASWPEAGGRSRVLFTAIGLVLFITAMPLLGFMLAGTAFMLVLLVVVLRRRWLPSLATTAITIGLLQGIFVQWLSVKLPSGPWGF